MSDTKEQLTQRTHEFKLKDLTYQMDLNVRT